MVLFNFRKNFIKCLVENNFDVFCLSPYDGFEKDLKKIGAQTVNLKLKQHSSNPIDEISTMFNLFRMVQKVKPKIILNFTPKNNIYGTVIAKLGIKIINNISGLGRVFSRLNSCLFLLRIYINFHKDMPITFFQNKKIMHYSSQWVLKNNHQAYFQVQE